jgi:hypothetical protein
MAAISSRLWAGSKKPPEFLDPPFQVLELTALFL